jgi:hypothetical protein
MTVDWRTEAHQSLLSIRKAPLIGDPNRQNRSQSDVPPSERSTNAIVAIAGFD